MISIKAPSSITPGHSLDLSPKKPIEILSIKVSQAIFHLCITNNEPSVLYGKKNFREFKELLKEAPFITQYIKEYSKILLFMQTGLQFNFIDNIERYQKNYLNKPQANTLCGKFDITQMHPPKVENSQLIFFVDHDYYHTPYKVICPFPYDSEKCCLFQLLDFCK